MKLSVRDAVETARQLFSKDARVQAIQKRLGDRASMMAQMTEKQYVCRVGIYVGYSPQLREKRGHVSVADEGAEMPCIVYCDISLTTGVCSEIAVLHSLGDIEGLEKTVDEAYIRRYGL